MSSSLFLKTPLAVLTAALLSGASSNAALTFSFTYTGDDSFSLTTTEGLDRRNAFEQAALTLGSFFLDTAILNFTVKSETVNNDTLASAGSDLHLGGVETGGFFRTVAQQKAITGIDPNGTAPDGEVNWNFHHNWDTSASASSIPANGGYDFRSTVMHELAHALGFISGISAPGGNGTNRDWYILDRFLTDKNGTPLINPTTFAYQGGDDVIVAGAANGVHFSGANAVAGYGGNRVPMFSPNPYQEGSSGSHLDDAFFTSADYLMEAATLPGPGARTLSQFEIGMFTDLGYTMIPEPGSVSLLALAGSMLLGLRRRRS